MVPSCRSMVLALVLSFAIAGAERAEVVHHRLVDQDVAVGEEEDALLAAGLPQPPDDLEGGVGLAGAGRHDQQDAVLALGDGLDRGVDGVDLVVARAPCRCRRRSSPGARSASASASGPSRRDSVAHSSAGDGKASRARVRSPAWRSGRCGRGRRSRRRSRRTRRGCRESRRSRGACCMPSPTLWLLSLASIRAMRDVRLVVEDVVGPLGLAAGDQLAADDDAALGEADLLADLRHLVPPGRGAPPGVMNLVQMSRLAEVLLVH